MKRKIIYKIFGISCILFIAVCLILSYLLFCPFKQKIDCSTLSVQIIRNNNKQYVLLHSKYKEDLSNPLFPLEMIDICYLDGKLAVTQYHSFNIFSLHNPICNSWPIAFSDGWVIPPNRNIKRKIELEIVCWNGKKYQNIGSFKINSNSDEIIFCPKSEIEELKVKE